MAPRAARRLALVLLPLAGAALCGGLLTRWATHRVSLRPAPAEGPPRFELEARGVNAIVSVTFRSASTGETLWAFGVESRPVEPQDLPSVTYGELPWVPEVPRLRRVKQFCPEAGKPRPIVAGERFGVEVAYQYDTAVPPAACQGQTTFLFVMGADGTATPLGQTDSPVWPGREDPDR
jgi:hypothetical protein